MAFALGIDTSNYTTSAAIYDSKKGLPLNCGRPLRVEKGGRGLRQSDAVFSHTKNLPEVFAELFSGFDENIDVIGVSETPRETQGSYMPCFLSGLAVAKALSSAMRLPLMTFSHQAGHTAAAAYGSGHGELLKSDFLAWHLSGGTSELLYVTPSRESVISCERIGGTSDASAGQIIDRAGVALGLDFPCGAQLDRLSSAFNGELEPAELSVKGLEMSLSGLENKLMSSINGANSPEKSARLLFLSLFSSVSRVTQRALEAYPGLPLLCSGGVMSNSLLREKMTARFNAIFAQPSFSADNAAGTAVLAYLKYKMEKGGQGA